MGQPHDPDADHPRRNHHPLDAENPPAPEEGRAGKKRYTLGMGRPRIPVQERIRMYTRRTDTGCLEWTGCLTRDGYGKMTITRYPNDWTRGMRTVHVHRLVMELETGNPVPAGLHVHHICRNRRCCERTHLRILSPHANVMAEDSAAPPAANATKTYCAHGHPFDDTNTRWYPGLNGRLYRACRACRREIYPSTRDRSSTR